MVKLIKVIQKETYKGKDGKDHHYTSFYLESENGKRVNILPNTNYDDGARIKLDMMTDETINNANG